MLLMGGNSFGMMEDYSTVKCSWEACVYISWNLNTFFNYHRRDDDAGDGGGNDKGNTVQANSATT